MDKEDLILTVSNFIKLISIQLPDDVFKQIKYLALCEHDTLPKIIYEMMMENQSKADELVRPCCQDTGVLQFYIECGTKFSMLNDLEQILLDAVRKATFNIPLRHNSIETFEEYNTGNNIGKNVPNIYWDIIPDANHCDIFVYMAGGGCSLPGSGKTFMPAEGYEAVVEFVFDLITSYGLNACPPLLVGLGIGTSIDQAAYLSKKALMRPVCSHNDNPIVKELEISLEKGLNRLGIGPQGIGGENSVLGVNIENSARHPSVLSAAVNVGCWSHRRGHIRFHNDLSYKIISHSGVDFR